MSAVETTDGNILVSRDDTGVRLWLVDLSRARISSRPVPFWNRWRDLARPGLNRPEDLELVRRKRLCGANAVFFYGTEGIEISGGDGP